MLRNRPRPVKPPRKMPTNPKPTLEMLQMPVFRVHRNALESYITKVFGFEFDFCLAAGVTEGMCVEYAVDGVLPSVEWERRAGELRSGRRTREVRLILNTLAHDRYIPKGHYTVSTHRECTQTGDRDQGNR